MTMMQVKEATGMDKVILKDPRGATVTVDIRSAQITSWKDDRGDELLFSSSKVNPSYSKGIRGGISLGFPKFGNLGASEHNCCSRKRLWIIDSSPPPLPICGNKAFVDLLWKPIGEDLKVWPKCFEFRLQISLGAGMLMLTSRIRNMDSKPYTFTFTLHTYLLVSDISEVRVEGLETSDYFDNIQQGQRFTEQGDALTFDAEVDRVYLNTPSKIAIIDHEKKRTFVLKKDSGLPDAAVWNPWEKKCKSIVDLGDEDYKRMVCVKAAAIENPIVLKPG
eukprot:c37099_g1_i1 orf=1-828(-)